MAMSEGIRSRVREFARNLRLATFDARVERRQAAAGHPTLFYYDTDVVLPIIMGFELPASFPNAAADLVRSLLACFMLGPMYMLRPHALELRNHLGSTSARAPGTGAFKLRAQDHLRGHESKMEQLRAIVTGTEKVDGLTKAERFIRLFRANSSATFVALEQISGHWTQRLKRHYGRSICLDHLGPEMQELLQVSGDIVQRIFLLLDKHRSGQGRENLQDAAALAILSQMVKDWQRDRARPIVRFYSESPALWNTWRGEPDLRALLSYPPDIDDVDSAGGPGSEHVVFRDTAYFLARARFRELAPGTPPEPLDKLERLHSEVEATDRMDPDEFRRAISQIRYEGKSIGDIIQEFEDFSLMRAIWRRTPSEFAESVEEWTDVFAFAMGRETGEALVQKISVIRDDLEDRLSHIVRWTGDRTNLLRAALDMRKRIRRAIEDPMRDLGLVRWGYDLQNDEKQSVIHVVDNLMQSAEHELDLQSAALATRMETARSDVRECLVITAILWVMRLWPEIDRVVEDCARATDPLPASLRLIQAAARIRSARLDQDAKQALIDHLAELGRSVPRAQQGGYFLGLGYVLYQAWKQELRGAWVFEVNLERMPQRVRAWAARCFEVGDEAARLLRDADDLAWAYAVNHCAYVGLTTGVEPDRTQRYLLELSELNGRPAVWNARFDDTLGTDFLLRAESGLRSLDDVSPAARPAALQKIREHLARAESLLDQARGREFGDIDVDYHLRRVEVASDQLARRSKEPVEPAARAGS
ncbi:MAG TPA: hypothetical protein VHW23_19940 [Kofleriaceae bacterium]|jgi:hypothetical protein|nr:hypothetical protein [Kofleriaceae bacterium]